jgi:IS30 family transposase
VPSADIARQRTPSGGTSDGNVGPVAALRRQALGHWEIDTVMGTGSDHCIVTLVERATGYLLIGKLAARSMDESSPRMARVTQRDCNAIARKLNNRPRKRYHYQTPEERFHAA